VTRHPETVLADAGYWHKKQMENIVSDGIQVLVPPDAVFAREPGPARMKACTRSCAECSPATTAASSTSTRKRSVVGPAGIQTVKGARHR